MKKKHDIVTIDGYLVHETGELPTEGAFLVRVEGDKEVWLPKLVTEKTEHENGKPNYYTFDIPYELAFKKGLI